jgi:hypothetical protein
MMTAAAGAQPSLEIKTALYSVLGRRRMGQPIYNVIEDRGGGPRQGRYRCELSVAGIDYGIISFI